MPSTAETSKSLPVAGLVTSTVTPAKLLPELDSSHSVREIIFRAHPDNTDNILIGNKTAQGLMLAPGESLGIPIGNPGEVYHKAESGSQVLGFLGRD